MPWDFTHHWRAELVASSSMAALREVTMSSGNLLRAKQIILNDFETLIPKSFPSLLIQAFLLEDIPSLMPPFTALNGQRRAILLDICPRSTASARGRDSGAVHGSLTPTGASTLVRTWLDVQQVWWRREFAKERAGILPVQH